MTLQELIHVSSEKDSRIAELERELAAKDAEIVALQHRILSMSDGISESRIERDALQKQSQDLYLEGNRLRNEIVALSAGLRLAHEQMYDAGISLRKIESTVGRDSCKRALEERDRALVGPPVEALDEQLSFTPGGPCQNGLIATCRCEKCKNARALAALAPYKAHEWNGGYKL